MDNGYLILNLMFLVVFYFFVGLVGGMSGIILIFINKREIESLRNLVVDNVNGRYEKMDFVSCKFNKIMECLMFVFFGMLKKKN